MPTLLLLLLLLLLLISNITITANTTNANATTTTTLTTISNTVITANTTNANATTTTTTTTTTTASTTTITTVSRCLNARIYQSQLSTLHSMSWRQTELFVLYSSLKFSFLSTCMLVIHWAFYRDFKITFPSSFSSRPYTLSLRFVLTPCPYALSQISLGPNQPAVLQALNQISIWPLNFGLQTSGHLNVSDYPIHIYSNIKYITLSYSVTWQRVVW